MGTEVEVLPPQDHQEPTTAALAVRHEDAGSLVRPAAPLEEIAEAFMAYQAMCRRLLVDEDYQQIGRRAFRKKSAWRKLATAFGVSTELVSKDYERDERGRIIRAEVLSRAVAPNGRYMDGLGACDAFERCCDPEYCTNTADRHRHCEPDCNGFSHFSKPSHDIPATAMTRATNRACADLFGFGEVSAEEVDTGAGEHAPPARQGGGSRPNSGRAGSQRSAPVRDAAPAEDAPATPETVRAIQERMAVVNAVPGARAALLGLWQGRKLPAPSALLARHVKMAEAMVSSVEQRMQRGEWKGERSEEDPGRPFEPAEAPTAAQERPETSEAPDTPPTRLERPCQGCGGEEATTALDGVELCAECEKSELDYQAGTRS